MSHPSPAFCSVCGAPQSANAPAGLCPCCLMELALKPDDDPALTLASTGSVRVLDALSATCGLIPRLLLPDTDGGDDQAPMVSPSSDEMRLTANRPVRVQLLGEIARGGMGVVLKGRDPDLGRDLAVKVLLEKHDGRPEMVRRFVEEAQIGGQLQHPGIVPVYELGAFGDLRPYFTMKLVKGRTLAALLAERDRFRNAHISSPNSPRQGVQSAPISSPLVKHDTDGGAGTASDLPRFLAIFEAVCQTVAYAHARGVIHRDLKPSNVMVGSFGEVQVMDWGLAKVLRQRSVADDPTSGPETSASVIATVRSGSTVDESEAGSVLGTPAYMSPEQASGELELVDQRADVFGLGSMLCEILIGQPPYTAGSQAEVLRKAMRGDIAFALHRLDGCGADAELVALAKSCLAAERDDRPRDAGVVAGRLTGYLAGVQARVQLAERERAVALARAEEERRRRKLQLGLAAALLGFTTLGGFCTTYYLHERQAEAAAIERIVGRAATLRDQAVAHADDLPRWQAALAAVDQADARGDREAEARLAFLRTQIQSGLNAARRDQEALDRLVDIRSAEADDRDGSRSDSDYAEAFRDIGIDVAMLPPAVAGEKIRAHPPAVARALAAALDDWAGIRRTARRDAAGAAQLGAVARNADPDPWRNDLRSALDRPERAERLKALQALARSAKFDALGPVSLFLLGHALYSTGDYALAESVLRATQERYPGDLWVNQVLGSVLERLSRGDDAIRFYTAARAIRPETAHTLAHALLERGQKDEALAVFRDLRRLRPRNASHLTCLGNALKERGLVAEANEALDAAVAAGRERIRLKPDDAFAHETLARALHTQGQNEESIAEYRAGIRLEPDAASIHYNLALALNDQGRRDEAIAEYRTAIRLKPDHAQAHCNFGIALNRQGKQEEAIAEYRAAIRIKPDLAQAHYNLGDVLYDRRKWTEATAEYRATIRLKPDFAQAHIKLGNALSAQGQPEEASTEFRTAIRLKPDDAEAHNNLGNVLSAHGKIAEAVAEYGKAIAFKPDLAKAHYNLGINLAAQGKAEEAVAEYRAAIRLEPNHAQAHCNLGVVFFNQRKWDEAIGEYRAAIGLHPALPDAHNNLGVVLLKQGRRDEAIAEFRAAIRVKHNYAAAHNNLGDALKAQGSWEEATASYRTAVRLQPDYAEAHCNLGHLLRRQGDLSGALEALRRGHELGSRKPYWHYPSAAWVEETKRMLAVSSQLPALLRGEYKPQDDAERVAFAETCYKAERYAAGARLWAEALESDPKLVENRAAANRYNAACAAALAGCGRGKDDPKPDAKARSELRTQALAWLKAELTAWTRDVDGGNAMLRANVVKTLGQWEADSDLAGVRDQEGLAGFSAAERAAWRALWAQVDATLARAGSEHR